jgi:integrase/recombinase XerD
MTVRDLCLVEPRPRCDEATHGLVDRYVEFVAARCRPNTVAATRSDLGVFFSVLGKPPVEVTASDVLEFIAVQRRPRGDGRVVCLADDEAGLSARTIKRRVTTASGFFAWLTIIGAVNANPVPRGLSTRRRGRRRWVPLVRTPRTLPRVLDPDEVNALLAALARGGTGRWSRRWCWAGCAAAKCSACASKDLRPVERRVFIADGKGRPPAAGADLRPVLRQRRPLPRCRTSTGSDHRSSVRRAQRPPAGSTAVRGRPR